MSKHTQGPWRQDKWDAVITASGSMLVTDGVALGGRSTEETRANARLIAAAPELLEALKWHRDALDLGDVAFYERHGFNVSEVMPRTRAIVKKAEGEQQ